MELNLNEKNKVVAGVLGILLGSFGAHKFYLGYNKEGIMMAIVGVLGFFIFGIGTMVVEIVGIIEGVMYLTKDDEEFRKLYVEGRKSWF